MADLPPTVEMSGRRIRDQVINEGQPSNAKRRAEELMAIGESPGVSVFEGGSSVLHGQPSPSHKISVQRSPTLTH